jgi:hypothetical protein
MEEGVNEEENQRMSEAGREREIQTDRHMR